MLNIIWLGLIVISVIAAIINGKVPELVTSVTESAKLGFDISLGLAGIMVFWLGLMKVAEEAGFVLWLGNKLKPILTWLFKDVPPSHPAMGSMTMNMSANMLGIGNAATPFGIKAMQDLQSLNTDKETASDAMCMLLAINTSSIQLIPATAIAYLAAAGAAHPTQIIVSSLIATTASTIAAIIAVKTFQTWRCFQREITA